MNDNYLYRIEEIYNSYELNKVKLQLKKYKIIKRTEKGVWIKLYDIDFCNCKKFILLRAKKKFAYKTKEEALESFKIRKNKQIEILRTRLDKIIIALNLANNVKIQDYE